MAENNPFWSYSVTIYSAEGVAPACLTLQDNCGVDVNILLFCCWSGSQGLSLSPEQLQACLAATDPWSRDIVQSLRTMRQSLKGGFHSLSEEQTEPLRQKILALELEAEKTEQQILADAVLFDVQSGLKSEECLIAAATNIAAYFKQAQLRDVVDRDHHLGMILSACYPECTQAQVLKAVTNAF